MAKWRFAFAAKIYELDNSLKFVIPISNFFCWRKYLLVPFIIGKGPDEYLRRQK
jgi:hypothetical protein